MDFSGWARHQLRAQGRKDRRAQALLGFPLNEEQERSSKKDTITRTNQFLDFLSRSTAQTEKALLKPTAIPDFARVKSFTSGLDIDSLIQAKRKTRRAFASEAPPFVATLTECDSNAALNPDSLLCRLADTLADQAMVTDASEESTAPASDRAAVAAAEMAFDADVFACDLSVEPAHAWLEGDFVEDNEVDESAVIMLERAYVTDLDQWFSACNEEDSADDELDDGDDFADAYFRNDRLSGLPRVLPPAMPNPYEDTGDLEESKPEQETGFFQQGQDADEDYCHHQQRRRYSRSLYSKVPLEKPHVKTLSNGTRLEKYKGGATLAKDALGRVTEVHSVQGGLISIQYDGEGQPETFVRCDARGRAHSLGERDRHGVVVRDPEGRVRAAGESMAVDPNGCISVRRFDGQFWSLDLIRGLHIERRRLCDRQGEWNSLTAVFAFDGFRMMTRFQRLGEPESDIHASFVEPSGRFRFYGRDGSVVQFDNEDDLVELKPSQVWPPASRHVEPLWRGHLQGGTAWQSVQEYVTNYLLA
jgi:hypothetical protein